MGEFAWAIIEFIGQQHGLLFLPYRIVRSTIALSPLGEIEIEMSDEHYRLDKEKRMPTVSVGEDCLHKLNEAEIRQALERFIAIFKERSFVATKIQSISTDFSPGLGIMLKYVPQDSEPKDIPNIFDGSL